MNLPSPDGWQVVDIGEFGGADADDLILERVNNGEVIERAIWIIENGGLAQGNNIPSPAGWQVVNIGNDKVGLRNTAFDTVGRNLMIYGTDHADSIQVEQDAAGHVDVFINDRLVSSFDTVVTPIAWIYIYGRGGNDEIRLSGLETIAAEVHGNAGNDTIWGTQFADQLYGDAGDGSLDGNGGNDELDGGPGYDRLNGGSGDDIAINGEELSKVLSFEDRLALRWAPVLMQDVDTTGGVLGAFDHSAGGRSHYIIGVKIRRRLGRPQ